MAATVLSAAPASATYGAPIQVDLSVSGQSQLRGEIHGTIQFDDGRHLVRWDLTFCRDSSFVAPTLDILINGSLYARRFHGDYGQVPSSLCSFAVHLAEEANSASPVCLVTFLLTGSSFDQNNVFREHRAARSIASPYC